MQAHKPHAHEPHMRQASLFSSEHIMAAIWASRSMSGLDILGAVRVTTGVLSTVELGEATADLLVAAAAAASTRAAAFTFLVLVRACWSTVNLMASAAALVQRGREGGARGRGEQWGGWSAAALVQRGREGGARGRGEQWGGWSAAALLQRGRGRERGRDVGER